MSFQEALAVAEKNHVTMVDMKFVDFLGTWQHFSVPMCELNENAFENGFGFDGSSIRGWQPIEDSDMIVIPDSSTAQIDPFMAEPTLSLVGNIFDPITREAYTRDPRFVAQKAEKYLKSTGIADTCFIGPEPEFFVFDDIRFDQNEREGFYRIDSSEGHWNSGNGSGPNLGYKPRAKGGYFPAAPTDSLQDLRTEMTLELQKVGIYVECQHHEVATAGQSEIDMRYAPLLSMGDQFMWFKYVIRNVAKRHGKTVTFMPKPIFDDNGSGMHTHISLWRDNNPLFAGDQYGGMSQEALWFAGGILKHAPALLAFTNPTSNSYKRLVPGFEAPISLAYSTRNRSAAIRIPMYNSSPKAKRLEFRTPDASCNGYLAFSALMMAGLDGIKNKIDPGSPLDKNIYALSSEELQKIPQCPVSLEGALEELRDDYEFLLEGDVFTKDVIDMWIDYKMENEVQPLRLRPTPFEFSLYYDV